MVIENTKRLFKIAKESLCSLDDMLATQWCQKDKQDEFERHPTLNSISRKVFKSLVSIMESEKDYEMLTEEEA